MMVSMVASTPIHIRIRENPWGGSKLHWIWYLVSYGILCHYGNFSYDTSYE
jgi:hypothetical protein